MHGDGYRATVWGVRVGGTDGTVRDGLHEDRGSRGRGGMEEVHRGRSWVGWEVSGQVGSVPWGLDP